MHSLLQTNQFRSDILRFSVLLPVCVNFVRSKDFWTMNFYVGGFKIPQVFTFNCVTFGSLQKFEMSYLEIQLTILEYVIKGNVIPSEQ